MTTRASGRAWCSTSTTSRPLPDWPSLRSTTAKAGGALRAMAIASSTVSAVETIEAARFHGAREALAKRRVVIDDQKAFVGQSFGGQGHGVPCPQWRRMLESARNIGANGGEASPACARYPLEIEGFSRLLRGKRHANDGAAAGLVAEGHGAAGAFDQRLGDEEAEAHARVAVGVRVR